MLLLCIPRAEGHKLDLTLPEEHPAGRTSAEQREPLETGVLLLEPAQLMGITPGGAGTPKQLMTMEQGKQGHLGWAGLWSCSQPAWWLHALPVPGPASPGLGGPGALPVVGKDMPHHR